MLRFTKKCCYETSYFVVNEVALIKAYHKKEVLKEIIAYLNWCDFIEVLGVRNTQAAHSMLMSPFLEMPFISPSTPVAVVPTYLAFEFLKGSHKNVLRTHTNKKCYYYPPKIHITIWWILKLTHWKAFFRQDYTIIITTILQNAVGGSDINDRIISTRIKIKCTFKQWRYSYNNRSLKDKLQGWSLQINTAGIKINWVGGERNIWLIHEKKQMKSHLSLNPYLTKTMKLI